MSLLLLAWETHAHGHGLGPAAAAHAPHRTRLGIVEADGGANIGFCGAGSIGGIEAYPAKIIDIGLGPGMARGMGLMTEPMGNTKSQ